MDGSWWTSEALPKAVVYAAVQFITGIAVMRVVLIRKGRPSLPEKTLWWLDERLAVLGVIASMVAIIALAGRAVVHTATVFGTADALHWENLRVIVIESRWGEGWRLQTFAAAGILFSAFAIRARLRPGWPAFGTGALALCVVVPRLGHGADSAGSWLLHVLHLLAGSVWLGTLAVIVALYFAPNAADSEYGIRDSVQILISHFSKTALLGAAAVVMTGIVAALIYVSSLAQLGNPYGQTLLLKIMLFFGVVFCGWSNWRRARKGERPRPQMLIAELSFSAAIVLVTGFLTETNPS